MERKLRSASVIYSSMNALGNTCFEYQLVKHGRVLKKLKRTIVSEEYKFWKFISGRKYLKEDIISLDKRLLRNFYLNSNFYDQKISKTENRDLIYKPSPYLLSSLIKYQKKKFKIDDALIPNKGRLLKCGSCSETWFFNKNTYGKLLLKTNAQKTALKLYLPAGFKLPNKPTDAF